MPKTRKYQSNFTAGEASPRIEARPDMVQYYNSCKTLQNFIVFPQGGATRRLGTRFVCEVKDSNDVTYLLPFEFNIEQAYAIEAGDLYFRFYKNGARIENPPGTPYEIASPYTSADLPDLQYRQSADVMYITHPNHAVRRLSRISDTSWSIQTVNFDPPPSYEADTDISGGSATLTPGAVTGTNITFTASSAVFLHGDVGRYIIYGASRARIIQLGPSAGSPTPNAVVKADIIDDFPNTSAIAAGSWFLRLSPQATLDPDKKEPVGGVVALTAGTDAFRSADAGKFIKIYGGLVKITGVASATNISGEILSVMSKVTDANPAAAPTGAWTLEVASWDSVRGHPSAIEFSQGRLVLGGSKAQKSTFWESKPDDFENYAVGAQADDALEYTISSKKLNVIEWLADLGNLFIGDAENELKAKGQGADEPLGGDVIPDIRPQSSEGSASIMPLAIGSGLIFVQRGKRQVMQFNYSFEEDKHIAVDLTAFSEHITAPMLAQHPPVYAKKPDSIVYLVRTDGVLLGFTYYPREKVFAWSRIVTDGQFESVCAIPHPDGDRHQVWVVAKRTISGVTKRYVEYSEDDASEFADRDWQALYTDCAKVYNGSATATITGLGHLEGKEVDVIADGMYKGRKTVAGGQITLPEAASKVEVGLPYLPTLQTMRPATPQEVIEGLPRHWVTVGLMLKDSIGAEINGEEINFSETGQSMDSAPSLFTGFKKLPTAGWDLDGYITIKQNQPYPLTILGIFGTLALGESQ